MNAVGVDVNTASAPLLTRVSGIGAGLAENIVPHRDANGPFRTRRRAQGRGPARPEGVRAVRRLPAHPRRRRPARLLQRAPRGVPGGAADPGRRPAATCATLIGNGTVLRGAAARATSSTTRSACRPSPTSSPSWRSRAATRGRRSRPPPSPRAWRRSPTCSPGMVLEGVVTNVAAFGAFVDVGVHQDGLVHVSAHVARRSSRTRARWSSPATSSG